MRSSCLSVIMQTNIKKSIRDENSQQKPAQ
jgi:hypothetical protein